MGQSRPLFVYFRYFLDTISIKQIEKKCRWSAWESNPGPQDGRRRFLRLRLRFLALTESKANYEYLHLMLAHYEYLHLMKAHCEYLHLIQAHYEYLHLMQAHTKVFYTQRIFTVVVKGVSQGAVPIAGVVSLIVTTLFVSSKKGKII